ncbi:MAG: hypothetical protein M0Z27_01485, partial [Thermaerobacter sp.]|nr:hypothetical protein [Thermaerobacter sp.]
MAERDGRRVVVLLDELQETGRLEGQGLRANPRPQRRTAYRLLGSRMTFLCSLFADRGQAFYRFAVLEDRPAVPEDAWRSYPGDRLAERGIGATARVLDLLLERTGGHPHCTVVVAYHACLQTGMHADATLDRALEQMDSAHEAMGQGLRRAARADRVLAALALGGRPYTMGIPGSQVSRALRQLQEGSVL